MLQIFGFRILDIYRILEVLSGVFSNVRGDELNAILGVFLVSFANPLYYILFCPSHFQSILFAIYPRSK